MEDKNSPDQLSPVENFVSAIEVMRSHLQACRESIAAFKASSKYGAVVSHAELDEGYNGGQGDEEFEAFLVKTKEVALGTSYPRHLYDAELFWSELRSVLDMHPSEFQHNMPVAHLGTVIQLLEYIVGDDENTYVELWEHTRPAVKAFYDHGVDMLDMSLAHLDFIQREYQRALGLEITVESEACRVGCLSEYLRVVSESRTVIDAPVAMAEDQDPDSRMPEIRNIDWVFADDGEQVVSTPREVIAEALYCAVSNATKVIKAQTCPEGTLSEDINPNGFYIEVTTNCVEYEGRKFLVFEVFNTGKQIDITQIYQSVCDQYPGDVSDKAKVGDKITKLLEAVKQGSRQANMSMLTEGDLLFLHGFTSGTGGSGVGLGVLNDLVNGGDKGFATINNVYNAPTGVCVTIGIPMDEPDFDGKELIDTLKKLKNAMVYGDMWLSEGELKKAEAA